MLAALHLNKLQRKVLLVIVLIILIPMLITGVLSGRWVTSRVDTSIENWVRESAQLDETALSELHKNARLFADTVSEVTQGQWTIRAGVSPIPGKLQPLADELGISLVQVYGLDGKQIYSSPSASLATSWAPGQDTAVVKVNLAQRNLLAAITIIRIPAGGAKHYRLVLGTLFDKALLDRMSRLSGLKTRLFYPDKGDFAKAFAEDGRPLKLRLPASAFEQLLNKQSYYSSNAEDGRYWGLYAPVIDASGQVEAIWFSGYERTRNMEILTNESTLTLSIIFFGSLLALAVGLILSRVVVRPVEYLHNAVMKLAAQDFRTDIPIHSRDELGELARAFNAMADSLREARDQQQREFRRDKLSALGELSLAMAHEIRNPIGIINTASKLLETTEDPSRRSEMRRVIREESQRLNHLLNDFQQLARHRQPELKPIDPAEPLEKALKVMLAGRDEISVKRKYQHDKILINADEELLRQVWLNLLRNSLEAMGQGAGELEVGTNVRDDNVEVYMHDSGPGIPIEKMTRLFEPFFTTKQQGSGLGLTIANTLVEANGAQLEYIPGDWKGARFAMRIPIFDAEKV
jgi:nitrogen fixation/metabolism regulation signal transduction histidine kinase